MYINIIYSSPIFIFIDLGTLSFIVAEEINHIIVSNTSKPINDIKTITYLFQLSPSISTLLG